jgi:hypothetical protein
MAKWPLIPKEGPHRGRGHHSRRSQLPVFYMNDFSRLGLRVAPCDAARRALEENGYTITRDGQGRHVTLEGAAEVQAAMTLLRDRGIDCDIVDVVDQVYQG